MTHLTNRFASNWPTSLTPLLILLLLALPNGNLLADNGSFEEGLALLPAKQFDRKADAVRMIAESHDERAGSILKAMLEGSLFLTKKDKVLVYGRLDGSKYSIQNILTDEPLGLVKKRSLKKITINNRLRTTLKAALAGLNLRHPDPDVRLEAVESVSANPDAATLQLLRELTATEEDTDVREALRTALAIAGLTDPDRQVRLEALQSVQGNLNPNVRNRLQVMIEGEEDMAVQRKASSVLASIEAKAEMYSKIETIFFGLSLGSVLVLAAIGLAITFGVIGVINMAHGELIMLGAYTTYVIQQLLPNAIGWSLLLSVPAAFCVAGLTGILIERSVIRFLYGRPLETLLATFGISLILQQTVRSIFSPLNRSVITPEWMSGSIVINPVLSLTTNRVTILIFSVIVFIALYLLLKKSSLGLQVRAVSQNRSMARAMGVRAARVDALTFGLGSGIAGIAGVALSQLTNVGPNLGQAYIIDSFMVVVFGGVGNLWGTLVGGLSLGVANKFMEPWSGAVLAKILILVFIILFIQKRPQGLFPQKGRAAE